MAETASASSGSAPPKDLSLSVAPYWLCRCPDDSSGKTVTATANASGPGAEDAVVSIYGPNDQFAEGLGSATLVYEIREADEGTALNFNASATERPNRTGVSYVVKAVFSNLTISDGRIVFGPDDPDDPDPYVWKLGLDVPGGLEGRGIEMFARFEIVPFVPDPEFPKISLFQTCPFSYRVVQWIYGWQGYLVSGAIVPPPRIPTNHLEGVKIIPGTEQYLPALQIVQFWVGDDIGPTIGVGLLPLMYIGYSSSNANVYLQVKYPDCDDFQTIGKGTWIFSGGVGYDPASPTNYSPAGGFDGTNGSASDEQPKSPAN